MIDSLLVTAWASDRPPRPSRPLPVQPIRKIEASVPAQLDTSYLSIYFKLFIQPLPLFSLNFPIENMCCCFSSDFDQCCASIEGSPHDTDNFYIILELFHHKLCHKYDFRSLILGFFLPVNWWILTVLKLREIQVPHDMSMLHHTNHNHQQANFTCLYCQIWGCLSH